MKEMFMIAFVLSSPATGAEGNEASAYDAIQQASYKQSGLENMINNYVQRQLKYVPQKVQDIVGNSFLVGKIITERKVEYTWTF